VTTVKNDRAFHALPMRRSSETNCFEAELVTDGEICLKLSNNARGSWRFYRIIEKRSVCPRPIAVGISTRRSAAKSEEGNAESDDYENNKRAEH